MPWPSSAHATSLVRHPLASCAIRPVNDSPFRVHSDNGDYTEAPLKANHLFDKEKETFPAIIATLGGP